MRPLLTLLTMAASLCFVAALDLKDRDAIHEDDLARYDAYMETVQGSHAIDMYMEDDNNVIKVDLYDGATDTFEQTASFKASAQAPEYFAQLEQRAREVLGSDYAPQSTKRSICSGGGPNPHKRGAVFGLEERVSRCYQFCGYGSSCSVPSGCTRCRYVGGACTWQKWCI
ncbi:hypothetical protein B0T10DRAFT_419391 [Thelonectria olida]|uniref:Uncharacterized protein n=1 Tax=Thelonectria olida TaxID=1576542 RepID=A0A9P8VM96_9HYPO|nr:hypothetical protein B0T10DRAFT_419391 [Thelonectria olida]